VEAGEGTGLSLDTHSTEDDAVGACADKVEGIARDRASLPRTVATHYPW